MRPAPAQAITPMSSPLSAVTPPWTQPGWRDSAIIWIDQSLARLGRRRIGPVREHKEAWAGSSVLDMDTVEGRVFFKATAGVPSEAVVLAHLAARHPDALPRMLAHDDGRGWQLVEDFGGRAPQSPDDHCRVLATLAAVQRQELAHIDEWRRLGCGDHGQSWIATRLDHLLCDVPSMFVRHGLLSPDVAAELAAAADDAAATLRQLDARLPLDGLHHEDFRPGNTVITAHGPLIFDWADTVIAHPFFSAQRYLDDVDPGGGHAADWIYDAGDPRRAMREAYITGWTGVAPQEALEDAFTLTRVIEPLYQLARYDALMDLGAWAASRPAPEEAALVDLVFGALAHVRPGWTPGAISR